MNNTFKFRGLTMFVLSIVAVLMIITGTEPKDLDKTVTITGLV